MRATTHTKDNQQPDGKTTYYSGTSGLVLPVPNKQFVPEEFRDKSRLAYVASLYNSLEVNSSFYKVPMARTVAKWAADVPEGFQFTFKLWQGITHVKELAFDPEHVQRFMDVIAGVGCKKGCLLLQLPPGLKADAGQLRRLLEAIDNHNNDGAWKVSVEFRNKGWYEAPIYKVLKDYGAGMVMHDMPASATPRIDNITDFVYLRYHGPKGDYKGGYSGEFLKEQASYVNEQRKDGKTVYAYFNNTIGDAIKNLTTLNNYVVKEH